MLEIRLFQNGPESHPFPTFSTTFDSPLLIFLQHPLHVDRASKLAYSVHRVALRARQTAFVALIRLHV